MIDTRYWELCLAGRPGRRFGATSPGEYLFSEVLAHTASALSQAGSIAVAATFRSGV
jgi:hypothetical protein